MGDIKLPKKLIICCDGTWMNSDVGWEKDGFFDSGHPQTPSNVTRIARALKVEDDNMHPQIVYYQNGLGTSWSISDHLLGGGLALGLSENVRSAYGFLVNNYMGPESPGSPGDSLYFIGFSRGAFTARSVAGMVAQLGILTKDAMQYFYQIFEDFEGAGDKDYNPKLPKYLEGFKLKAKPEDLDKYINEYAAQLREKGMTREVKIKAVGVFDTVGSLGMPVQPILQKIGFPSTIRKYRFYDTSIDDRIENAFQALALDEHRSAFSPTIWEKKDDVRTNLKQVWFSGVHSNIGGGENDTGMSDITLAWMMQQLSPFLAFNEDYLRQQVLLNKASYAKQKQTWTWGCSSLSNSMKFPTSMAGSVTRTPDQYHVTDFATGRQTKDLLQNTDEHIHASVRARARLGGKTWDNKPYFSEALAGWELEDEDVATGKPARWTEKKGKKVMLEDKLGRIERIVLGEDPQSMKKLGLEQHNG